MPPARTSISSTTVPSPHHSGINCGSVQTEKTCSRGASKIRSTRISSSFGVLTAVSFSSAHRLRDELRDFGLVGFGQLGQCVRDRPHRAVVELRAVVEAEHRVALLELPRVAEEADHLAILVRVGGHPVPGLRGEIRRALLDDRVDPLAEGAIGRRHRRQRGEHGLLSLRLVLQLLGTRSHRGLFLGAESFLLLGRAHRAPFVRSTTWAKRSSRCSQVLIPSKAYGTSMHVRIRPTFSVVTSSASSSSRTCFRIPVSDMPNGSASSLIVALPAPSRSSTARRVGSPRAVKARSTLV